MSLILTPPRPAAAALENALRDSERRLHKITLCKALFRKQVGDLIKNARILGATEAEARVARDSAEDVLSDLFWDVEQTLAEEIERDEHLLAGG
jgi:hypothetical protein